MNHVAIVTCAVTGSGDTTDRSHFVPLTPKQIGRAAIEAPKAGGAIACVLLCVLENESGYDDDYMADAIEKLRTICLACN